MEKSFEISASVIYNGMPDYWSGDGSRWDDDKGCLFAYYSPDTTNEDIVQGWLEDFNMGGDFDGKAVAQQITPEELETALRGVFIDGIDFSATFGPSKDLEDFDEDGESPFCIVLVHISEGDDEE